MFIDELLHKSTRHICQCVLIDRSVERLKLASRSCDLFTLFCLAFLCSRLKDTTILIGYFCFVTAVGCAILGLFVVIFPLAILILLLVLLNLIALFLYMAISRSSSHDLLFDLHGTLLLLF